MQTINLGRLVIPVIVPQKGVDYYTETEKQELITEITNNVNSIIQPQETIRQTNEASRVSAELIRQSNEDTRQNNEEIRQANESSRQSAETSRAEAEILRQTSEINRQSAESTRSLTFAEKMEAVDDAINEIEDKTEAYNNNATHKTTDFNNNVTQKTTEFNNNATSKISDFNTNASSKTNYFDDNAIEKTTAFNANATNKTNEFDAHVASLQTKITNLEETVNSELEDEIAEGTEITVNDSANADGSLLPNGNTSQSENYPQSIHTLKGENTIKVSNKNWLKINDFEITRSGVNISSKDGVLKLNGTATSNINYDLNIDNIDLNELNKAIVGKTITLSRKKEWTEGPQLNFAVDGNTYYMQLKNGTNKVTKTNVQTITRIRLYIASGLIFSNDEFEIQLEIGSTDTDYEPHKEQIKTLTLPTGLEMCNIEDYRDKFVKQGDNWIVPNKIQKIESYNGETITTPYISTTGGLDIGATVYYVGETNLIITDTTLKAELDELLEIRTYLGQTNIIVEAEDLEPMMTLNYKKTNRNLNNEIELIKARLDLLEG